MIYTGYFAKTNKYIEAGLEPVSIATVTPQFFNGDEWLLFAPKKELLRRWKAKSVSNEEYTNMYLACLDMVVTDEVIESMKEYIKDKNVVMCCYEKPSDFCHRHALAKWLNEKLGEDVKEYELN